MCIADVIEEDKEAFKVETASPHTSQSMAHWGSHLIQASSGLAARAHAHSRPVMLIIVEGSETAHDGLTIETMSM